MSIRPTLVLLVAGACGARPTPPPVEPLAIPLVATSAAAAAVTTRDDLTPPWTLTASDGSGLAITRIDARAVVEGPLAFTELHLYFANPEARIREGTFQITLPPRAAISRFAMESDGRWLEAEVVPKPIARRAYDDLLHRRTDPALLEKAAGNQFTAKVFPIAASGQNHLVVSYSHALPGVAYTLPLRGLPRVARIDLELAITGGDGVRHRQVLAERDWTPDRDFTATAPTGATAVTSGHAIAAQIELGGTASPDPLTSLTILVDTSASRSLGYARYLADVRTMIEALPPRLPIVVVAFDQDTQTIFDGPAGELGDAHLRALLERGAAGASDLGQALASVARARLAKQRVLLIGDAVITAGREDRELAAAATALGVERFDVALVGGLRDERVAAALVTTAARPGAVLELEGAATVRALGEAVLRDIAIEVPGASWVYPRRIASARAGSKRMVYAYRDPTAPDLQVIAGGVRQPLRAITGTGPLVQRAVASAELAELEGRLATARGDERTNLRTTITNKSVAARVLSSETSMLVLETTADYARYGIRREALVDILVIGPRGLETRHRSAPEVFGGSSKPAEVATRDPIDGAAPSVPPAPVTPAAGDRGADNDRDGILDVDDRCPGEPESFNGQDDDDGCPDRARVVVTESSIQILEPVFFEIDKAVIRRSSTPILDAVAATLRANPEIQLLEIQGHSDRRGDGRYNLDLSRLRAEAVREYLVTKGIAADRLTAQGYGATQPIDRRDNPQAWARNRRVDFLILQRGDVARPPASPVSPASPAPPAPRPPPPAPVVGELAAIQHAIAAGELDRALGLARTWHAREPGNVLALIGLGEALEASRADATAARVYGSIIDLFPGRVDLRRFAGERLARLAPAHALAIDTFRRAVADRPDHLTGHRLLAYAYARAGRHAEAFDAILTGLGESYRETSYRGGLRVLAEDAAILGAVYAAAEPAKRTAIAAALAARKLAIATTASTRFVLHWETDANDVDLHVRDARGNHAFYSQPRLSSGGELYADVTTGYGPECFAIQGTPTAGPYQLAVHYYAQGPMGYGMGLLEVVRFDGKRLALEPIPFVVMTPRSTLALGTVR